MINTIRIIGAGTMGRGIAQTAATAGITVELTDVSAEAVDEAVEFITSILLRSVEKGTRTASDAQAVIERIRTGIQPTDPTDTVDLVIEAVVENLEVKQRLFRDLESAAPHALLASNTSSIPISAIGGGLSRPEKLIGLHFFNPVPLMKLVEIIPGIRTDAEVVTACREFTERVGHTPIIARDTPGFLVNHLGRALLTESLAALAENVAPVADIDRIVRDVLGLKMGPFELMDLTGLDVSHPVMTNVATGFYGDPRLRPSPLAAGRVSAHLFGRKTGEGFYSYADGRQLTPPEQVITPCATAVPLHPVENEALIESLQQAGVLLSREATAEAVSVVTPLGVPVHRAAVAAGTDPCRTIGIDPLSIGTERTVVIVPPSLDVAAGKAAIQAIAAASPSVTVTSDGPAPVAQRILAAIVNLGCALAEQSIGTPRDIDLGARLGLGYPAGPFELGEKYGPEKIRTILDGILEYTADPRYRASGWLRARAELGIPLAAMGTRAHDLVSCP
ncbi:3-hydroxyacyl-CoA dehydrogenase [Rhodococcus aetherivorans]